MGLPANLKLSKTSETVDLVTLTEKILNGKLHFLCGGISYECRIRGKVCLKSDTNLRGAVMATVMTVNGCCNFLHFANEKMSACVPDRRRRLAIMNLLKL